MATYPGLGALARAYKRAAAKPMGLFLGAGVNKPTEGGDAKYPVYLWEELLKEVCQRNAKELGEAPAVLLKTYRDDWPGLGTELTKRLGGVRALVGELDDVIYSTLPRGDSHGRLSKRFLEQAPTLHACICFASMIEAKSTESGKVRLAYRRNPRIRTVITPNYDHFFAAGWTRFQYLDWDVQTPFSEPRPGEGAIRHIHGYLPYRYPGLLREREVKDPQDLARRMKSRSGPTWRFVGEKYRTDEKRRALLASHRPGAGPSTKLVQSMIRFLNGMLRSEAFHAVTSPGKSPPPKRGHLVIANRLGLEAAYPGGIRPFKRTPAWREIKEVVLSNESYERSYASGEFADRVLRQAVRECSLLFVGTSFTDKPLREILMEERGQQEHFAIVKGDGELAELVRALGVCPVIVPAYRNIPIVLRDLYCTEVKGLRGLGFHRAAHYWERLQSGPR